VAARCSRAGDDDDVGDVGVHAFRGSSSSPQAAPAVMAVGTLDGLPCLLLLLFPLLDVTGCGLGREIPSWLGFWARWPRRLL
jgi:hypothetical protein